MASFRSSVWKTLLSNKFAIRKLHSSSSKTGLPNLSFSLFTDEHEEMQKTVKKIVDTHVNPYVDKWEDEKLFPAHQVFKKFGEAGLLGITRETQYGGLGLDYSYTLAFMEELAMVNCGGIPMAIAVHTDCSTPALARFGSDELKRNFLAPAIAGDVVSCIGVSEVGSGSDVASIKTTAKRVGDDLVINGGKMWTTNGCQADWMCMLANTREGPAHKNKSLIILPMKTPGVHVARSINKMGNLCSDTAQTFFEDVRIPAKYIIGEEGMGFTYQMLQFQEERLAMCSMVHVGLERAINDTVEYLKQRHAFGQPLIYNQSIHFRLAELLTEVEALKALTYKAAAGHIEGENVTLLASMAKLKAGKLTREVPDACLQFWGGMGYTNEVSINRMYRDMRLGSIGGGADEVMLSIICKFMGTLPPAPKKQ